MKKRIKLMKDTKAMMFIASVLGALGGVYYTTVVNPQNNFFNWIILFILIGAGIANVALLILVNSYRWLRA